jgi:Oxygenase, catalysing oxidative methylation of damaged DNA
MGEALGRAGVSVLGGGAWVADGRDVAHFLFGDATAAPDALHRDLYGVLVFILQVMFGLDHPGLDDAGGEFLLGGWSELLLHVVSALPCLPHGRASSSTPAGVVALMGFC